MPSSMTGFGQAEAHGYQVEVKGLNHRFKEIRVRLPRELSTLEMQIRTLVNNAIQRGKVDININKSADTQRKIDLSINWDFADACFQDLGRMAQRFGGSVNFRDIMWIPGVMGERQPEAEAQWGFLKEIIDKALESFLQSRRTEGERLQQDILMRLDLLRNISAAVKKEADGMAATCRDKLMCGIESLLHEHVRLDEMRLAQEVAILAEKCDITEELVRLDSHLLSFRDAMKSNSALGRRLDFMLQEIGRELNTIGSKSQVIVISHLVIDAKTEIEKIREQVQNIE